MFCSVLNRRVGSLMLKHLINILTFLYLSALTSPLKADTTWQELIAGTGSGNSKIIALPDTVLEGKNMRMNHWDSCWRKGDGPDHCLMLTDEVARLDGTSIKFESHPGDCGLYKRSFSSKNDWNNCYEGARRVFIGTRYRDWGSTWHTFSVYIPQDYVHSYTPLIFNQVHSKGNGAHYRMGINADGDVNVQLRSFGHDKRCVVISKKKLGKNICELLNEDKGYWDPPTIKLGNYADFKGKWIDVIVNVPNRKSLNIWANGVQIVNMENTMPSSSLASTNFGIYEPQINTGHKQNMEWSYDEADSVQVLYIDEIRFTKKCEQLKLADLGYSCSQLAMQGIANNQ